MKKLVFGLIATVVFAFNGNAQKLRDVFLEGKNQDQIVESFNKLTTDEKSDLWLEKLNQLLNEKFTSENLELIRTMRDSHVEKNLEQFKSASLNLAKVIPEEDFIKMFIKLEDYNYSGNFIGKSNVSNEIIAEIELVGVTVESKIGCNCSWTCSWYAGSHSHCATSDGGCGFLWISDCHHHAGP